MDERGVRADWTEAAAMLAADHGRLQRMWSPQLVVTPPGGEPVPGVAALERVRDGSLRYDELERSTEASVDLGGVVVTVGTERVVPAGSDRSVGRRYTHVWHDEQGSLRLITRHASELASTTRRASLVRIATFDDSPLGDRAWVIDALRTVPGCVSAYHLEHPETRRGVSVSAFTDAGAAEAATRAVAEFRVARGLESRGPDRIETYEVLHGF